jgi:hypothetical protein
MTNSSSQYILESCQLPDFIDITELKKYVKKDITGNKEYFDDLGITYRISDPKKSEWMIHKSIKNSKMVGNGHTYVDIIVKNKIGIDVSILTLNNKYTNEKSIIQNFSVSNDLDTLFKDRSSEKAVEIFKNKLTEKFSSNLLDDIYYVLFICNNKNIYVTCLKLNKNNITNMSPAGFSKENKNIAIDNFIDNTLGSVKLYSSKKRLELRLCKSIIDNENTIKLY